MKNGPSIALATLFGLGVVLLPVASASPANDACTALAGARIALYSMVNAKDKSAQDALMAKLRSESDKLDSVLAGMTGTEAKVAADFKAIWDQFKATVTRRSYRRSTRATPMMPRELPMAFN